MNPQLLAQVRLLSATEAALPNAVELATTRVKAMQDAAAPGEDKDKKITDLEAENAALKKKIKEGEDATAKKAEEEAAAEVKAAVTDGRIAAGDTETQEKFKKAIAAGNTFARENLDGLPKGKFTPGGTVVEVKAGQNGGKGVSRIEAAQAKAKAELGASAPFSAVWNRAQEIDPDAFND